MTPHLFYCTYKTRTKGDEEIYIDTEENNLILIVSPEGTKVFCFNIIVPLGNFPDMSVEEARAIAVELSLCIRKGTFFTKSNGSTELSFKELFDKYITDKTIEKIIYSRIKRDEDIYIDTGENNLILIVSPEGTKVFCFNTIVPLGNFPDMSAEEAKAIVVELSLCIRTSTFFT